MLILQIFCLTASLRDAETNNSPTLLVFWLVFRVAPKVEYFIFNLYRALNTNQNPAQSLGNY
jgi:hypothetical protein